MFKKEEPNIVYVGKATKKKTFVEAIKFGLGFYVGFNLGRMLKRTLILTNITK